MMIDERKHIRELACRKIKVARESNSWHSSSSGVVRKFIIPKLKFEATDYFELVNWLDFLRLQPPITRKFMENNLDEVIMMGNMPDLNKYPCHTQAVESHIKVVTDSSKAVCDEEQKEGYIRAKLESRKKMSKYTKKWMKIIT